MFIKDKLDFVWLYVHSHQHFIDIDCPTGPYIAIKALVNIPNSLGSTINIDF